MKDHAVVGSAYPQSTCNEVLNICTSNTLNE